MRAPEQDTDKPPIKEPERGEPPVNIDPDDAMIQEPKDDAFKKSENPNNPRPARKVPH